MKELINYSALSKMLTGNRNSIRSNWKIKKHAKKVERLENLIKDWYDTMDEDEVVTDLGDHMRTAVRRWHDTLQDKAL